MNFFYMITIALELGNASPGEEMERSQEDIYIVYIYVHI